ncbi:MAG: arylsulfatase [Cytophagales bacterium]|nr:arylsulfatase [Cytophagales bacterium]
MRALSVLFLSFIFFTCSSPKHTEQPPNVIIFLADDLGYGEIGILGQNKIKTPHIDALASSGMLFTNHYSAAPVCAPARYMLLTGLHSGHAFIRGNDEWAERGPVWDYRKASADPTLEGQRPIPANTVTLAKLLQQNGYTTGLFGKWGLGAPNTEGAPNLQGFDTFYGYNCQRQAHNLYPPHLWHNDKKDLLNNEVIPPRTPLDSLADPLDEASYARYAQPDYAPEKIHEQAMAFLDDHKEDPFFLYYASPLPHLPLQAPVAWVDRYRKEFGEEDPYLGDRGYFPNRYPRATYAAMISYLDHQLGEMVAKLKANGNDKNTVIFLTSDNGPTYTGGVDFDFFESSKPFTNGYGYTKGFVHEGGIRVPLIVNWPDQIAAGAENQHISSFYDLLPTICKLTGSKITAQVDGISFAPTLFNKSQPKHDYLYWEFPSYKGQQAVRMDHWKGIRKNMQDGNLNIALYDLREDEKEQQDVAADHPDVVASILEIMEKEHEPSENEKFKIAALGEK